MASFAFEEFVGNGVLRDQIDSWTADGWADVPTLKLISRVDMDVLQLSQLQRDALEIRTYLHDRLLMRYADSLEASGKTLSELLTTSPTALTSEFKMRRGHVARFLDMGSACAIEMPKNFALQARKVTTARRGATSPPPVDKSTDLLLSQTSDDHMPNDTKSHFDMSPYTPSMKKETPSPYPSMENDTLPFPSMKNGLNSFNMNGGDELKMPVLLKGPFNDSGQAVGSRGVFSAPEAQPRLCGMLRDKGMNEEVTPLSVLEKIMIQKLTLAHSTGANPFKKVSSRVSSPPPAPMKACDLWAEKPTLILCLRRPGCVMCRAEAHQLYTRKPIFDAMGIQLVVLLNEYMNGEVRAFWPRYWGGMVVVDEQREFFRALGQGKIRRENYLTGFFLNSKTLANFKRSTASGFQWNVRGEGNIKGGLYLIRAGGGGVAYQFVERNFGDWAPMDEVMEACENIMQIK